MSQEKNIRDLIERLLKLIRATPFYDDSLGYGRSGVALLYFYSARYFNDHSLTSEGLKLIEETIEKMGQTHEKSLTSADYFSGITGFLSVLANLRQEGLLDTEREEFNSLEEMVFEWAADELGKSNIDFFYGATGFIHYLLLAGQAAPTDRYLDVLVPKCLAVFEEAGPIYGIVNHTYNRMDKRQEAEINFSLAHGMGAVLLILVKLWQAGYRKFSIDHYIEKGIASILQLAEASPPQRSSCFTGSINMLTGERHYQKRLGWCFSDLNMLHLLYEGARTFGVTAWSSAADQYASTVAARKTTDETMVTDPFLCHGSAGLFQYYSFLHQRSGLPAFKESATYWLEQTLDYFEELPDEYFASEAFRKTGDIHSLFYGFTGVSLCLLSALGRDNGRWSSVIMLA